MKSLKLDFVSGPLSLVYRQWNIISETVSMSVAYIVSGILSLVHHLWVIVGGQLSIVSCTLSVGHCHTEIVSSTSIGNGYIVDNSLGMVPCQLSVVSNLFSVGTPSAIHYQWSLV